MIDTVIVNTFSPRLMTAAKVTIAHAIGLWIAGTAGSIGTTAGFSFASGGLGLLLGGILSIPWMAVLGVLIWFREDWVDRHPVVFAVFGPIVVCGTYALLVGAFIDAVAVSSVTSSICYLLMTMWMRVRRGAQIK